MSIGDDTSGARNEIFLVNGDAKSTSSAAKSMNPGNMMKSLICLLFVLFLVAKRDKRK